MIPAIQFREMLRRPVVIIAFWNAVAAVFAFFKDVFTAMFLGTSAIADAFSLAYFIPDMIGTCLVGAAIGAVSVPYFSKLLATGRLAEYRRIVWRISLQITLLSLLIYIVLAWSATSLLEGLIGNNGDLKVLTKELLQIMLPTIVLSSLASVGAAVHQSLHSFTVPVASPIFVNLVFLLSLLYSSKADYTMWQGIHTASWGVVVGVALMLVCIWIILVRKPELAQVRQGMRWNRQEVITAEKEMWGSFLLYGLILFAPLALNMAERVLAARMETGAVAALTYGFRIAQLPVWVFAAAFGAAILPVISKHLALKQMILLQETMLKSFRMIMLITIPVSVMLWILSEPVAALLFRRGAFDQNSVVLTSEALEGYSLTILFQSITIVGIRYFIAKSSLVQSAVLICSATFLVILLDMWVLSSFGVRGLGYGAAIGSLATSVFFLWLLNKEIRIRTMAKDFMKILACNAVPAIIIYIAASQVTTQFLSILQVLLLLIVTGIVYLLCYGSLLRVVRLI